MIDIRCNLCHEDDWQVRFPATLNGTNLEVDTVRCTCPDYGSHTRIVQCNHCGLVYSNPRWTSEELMDAYAAVEDETYQSEREGRELTFAKHLRHMENVVGAAAGRSLLDVGAYTGVFVETAIANGWDAWGVEPSTWAVAEAHNHGLNLINGTLKAPELSNRSFDVVTMWDVIEHFDDPADELAAAYRLLKPGGWLVVHTMDIDSLVARVMGKRWPWLMNMHLYYFSQKSLAAMLSRQGFQVVWSGAQGRYLRMSYLATRIGGLNRWLGRLAMATITGFRLGHVAVPVNFGDLFTVFARKPQ